MKRDQRRVEAILQPILMAMDYEDLPQGPHRRAWQSYGDWLARLAEENPKMPAERLALVVNQISPFLRLPTTPMSALRITLAHVTSTRDLSEETRDYIQRMIWSESCWCLGPDRLNELGALGRRWRSYVVSGMDEHYVYPWDQDQDTFLMSWDGELPSGDVVEASFVSISGHGIPPNYEIMAQKVRDDLEELKNTLEMNERQEFATARELWFLNGFPRPGVLGKSLLQSVGPQVDVIKLVRVLP